MASSSATASVEVELAWQLLTVLIRLGGPAAAEDLATAAAAAAEVTPRQIEWLCRLPGSPLRLSADVVTASEAAVVAFLRFAGWGCDASVPRVSLGASAARWWLRKMPIRYERRKRKASASASDAGCLGAKRRLLAAPDSDLDEHKQQLIAQSCVPGVTEEVHLEVMQNLQDRLATVGRHVIEPSLKFSTVAALLPSVPKISMPGLQCQINQFGGNDGSVHGNIVLALLPKELSDIPSVDISSLGTEKFENIHLGDDACSHIGDFGGAPPLHDCIIEDSDDLEKESTARLMPVQAALVGENKRGIKEDLNLRPGSPNAPNSEKAPTSQEMNSLGSNACAETQKTEEILFQSPTDTKAGPVEHEAIHEIMETFCQPSLGRKVEPAAMPLEVTGYDGIQKRDSNIIAENREGTHLNQGEQSRNEMGVNLSKEQCRKIVKQREKSKKNAALPKEHRDQFAAKAEKVHIVPKPLPRFKNFDVEEEEGSGGYGTVYRARRKSDGKVFAIKCPHAKARSHHVNNELKMLERFGGKNFVIKFECSFKSDGLECFVLEHVEHDRPENLKKEIDLFELQWYGYCLFKALASLHKQGIVHRDVKPGNFLFSRKMTKGYLIDFNLANDVQQKFTRSCKSETMSSGKVTISQAALKSVSVVCDKEAIANSKQPLASKRKRSSNRSPMGCVGIPKIDSKSRHGSQAADVSGVTSAKDPTSTKTSLDRLKQPMPYKGRKELMNFLEETMQSPNQSTLAAPVSQRKRVAAPFGNVDRKFFVLTPMPLHSGGGAVAGSGVFDSKGHGKHQREGPCVGTKGFRAPEVLFRSFHQGCKVDVWSAGVTLLYLILGRTPFVGDPEQNIKEIAKLRGSEELWEVAKLHNCESAYPTELFDIKSLHSMDLRAWCAANTRRPEFLELIPDSLFNLVDKCLAVNPRCRLSSEDALMHEYFAQCHEILRKRRTLRRSAVASSTQGTLLTVKAA